MFYTYSTSQFELVTLYHIVQDSSGFLHQVSEVGHIKMEWDRGLCSSRTTAVSFGIGSGVDMPLLR